jgi:hypothetical protein
MELPFPAKTLLSVEKGKPADLDLDRFSKCMTPCPAAEQPHWLRQPLARY